MKLCKHCQTYPVFSNGFCKIHQYLREKKPKSIKKVAIKANFKPSGEGIIFDIILSSQKHTCFVTGVKIDNASYYNCHHILTKAAYPSYRLLLNNIVLLSNECHNDVHTKGRSDLILQHPGWVKYFELYDKLREEYNNTKF